MLFREKTGFQSFPPALSLAYEDGGLGEPLAPSNRVQKGAQDSRGKNEVRPPFGQEWLQPPPRESHLLVGLHAMPQLKWCRGEQLHQAVSFGGGGHKLTLAPVAQIVKPSVSMNHTIVFCIIGEAT